MIGSKIFKNPTLLYLIFALELLERFSYYGFNSILVLYVAHSLNFQSATITSIYGTFIILLFLPVFVTGYICDRYITGRQAIRIGIILLIIGYITLMMTSRFNFFIGLSLIVTGNSFFKIAPPKILATHIKKQHHLIDSVFTLYYMAINIGSFLGMAIFPSIANKLGYGAGFALSAFFMVTTICILLAFYRSLPQESNKRYIKIEYILLYILSFATISNIALHYHQIMNLIAIALSVAVILILAYIFHRENVLNRKRLIVAGILMAESLVFFVPNWFTPLTLGFFSDHFANNVFLGFEINRNFFQALNPFWIFIFSPLLVYFYLMLERRDKKLSITKKFAIGTLIGGIGFLLIPLGSYFHEGGLISSVWIAGAYLCVAVGELLVRGLGLAMITKLTNPKNYGVMIGIWYLTTPIAILIGKYLPEVPHYIKSNLDSQSALFYFSRQFLVLGLAVLILGSVMLLIADKLSDMTKIIHKGSLRNFSSNLKKSLRNKIPRKMSSYFLVTGLLISVTILLVNNVVSKNMYDQQVKTWLKYFSKEITQPLSNNNKAGLDFNLNILKENDLFSNFVVFDSNKNIVASFGKANIKETHKAMNNLLQPIYNDSHSIVGYYYYTTDYNDYFIPFLWLIIICILVVIILYFVFNYILRKDLKNEFDKFGNLINKIESLSSNLSSLDSISTSLALDASKASEEEVKINTLFSKLVSEINDSHNKIKDFTKKIENEKLQIKLSDIAVQVSHDLRSPLSALSTLQQYLNNLPENHRILLRNTINRINYIAANLLEQYRNTNKLKNSKQDDVANQNKVKPELLGTIIEIIVAEKRFDIQNLYVNFQVEITPAGFSAFSNFNPDEMKRVISNLINNASEAFHDAAANSNQNSINIFLDADLHQIKLSIQDNGCGISKEKLKSIFESGVTYDKPKGSGLGLSHAKRSIESWSGHVNVSSKINEGTLVEIILPRTESPQWFLSKLEVSKKQPIVILDDDPSMHDAWRQRLTTCCPDLEIFHFTTISSFESWVKSENRPFQVLSDYELLNENETGLDVIERLQINESSTLVTSHYENNEIINRCLKINVNLLPKNLFPYIPICNRTNVSRDETSVNQVVENKAEISKFDLILIDDDRNMRFMWEMLAEEYNHNILTFSDIKSFEKQLAKFDKETVIYIDNNLGLHTNGRDYSRKLFNQGFKNIYLTTGSPQSDFNDCRWLKGVVGKDYPTTN